MPNAGIAAMLAGALATSIWKWSSLELEALSGITPLIAGVIANVLVFVLVYRLFRSVPDAPVAAKAQ